MVSRAGLWRRLSHEDRDKWMALCPYWTGRGSLASSAHRVLKGHPFQTKTQTLSDTKSASILIFELFSSPKLWEINFCYFLATLSTKLKQPTQTKIAAMNTGVLIKTRRFPKQGTNATSVKKTTIREFHDSPVVMTSAVTARGPDSIPD